MRSQRVVVPNFLIVYFLSFRENCLPSKLPRLRVHQLKPLQQSWVQRWVRGKSHSFKSLDLVVQLINLALGYLWLDGAMSIRYLVVVIVSIALLVIWLQIAFKHLWVLLNFLLRNRMMTYHSLLTLHVLDDLVGFGHFLKSVKVSWVRLFSRVFKILDGVI